MPVSSKRRCGAGGVCTRSTGSTQQPLRKGRKPGARWRGACGTTQTAVLTGSPGLPSVQSTSASPDGGGGTNASTPRRALLVDRSRVGCFP